MPFTAQGAILCGTALLLSAASPLAEKLRPGNWLLGCLAWRWYCQELLQNRPFEYQSGLGTRDVPDDTTPGLLVSGPY